MQTDNTKSQCKNIVQGRIVVKESGLGIPDLLVVVWNIDSKHRLHELFIWCKSYKCSNFEFPFCGDKIGSMLTSQDGSFSLSYEDDEFQIRNEQEKRPNLFLMVFAPEQMEKSAKDLLIFSSPEIRKNAGREEAFFIQLITEELEKAGHSVPKALTQNNGAEDLNNLEIKLTLGKNFADKKKAIFKAKVEEQYQEYASERTNTFTAKFKEDISTVPRELRNSQYFVKAGESVQEKGFSNIKSQLDERFNNPERTPPTSSGFIYLTNEQVQRYEQYLQGEEYILPPDVVGKEILPILFGGTTEGTSGNDFIMNHPAARACVKDIKTDLCPPPVTPETPILLGRTVPDPSMAAALAPADVTDINLYIATQMEHVSAPEVFGEGEIGVGDHGRADADAIAASINKLEFRKGPADVPAYFDFHTLKIAFPHVWKEAIDQGIIENGEALYDMVVAAGINPTMSYEEMLESINARVNYFMGYSEVPVPPPVQVVLEFPGAVPVWGQMSDNEKTVLERIANVVLVKYSNTTGDDGVKLEGSYFYNYLTLGDAAPENDDINIPLIKYDHLIDRKTVEVISYFRQKGQKIVDQVIERVEEAQELKSDNDIYNQAAALANTLKQNLQRSYSLEMAPDFRTRR